MVYNFIQTSNIQNVQFVFTNTILNPYPNRISGLLNKDRDDLTFDIQTLPLSSLRRGRGKLNRRQQGKRGGRRKQRHAINFASTSGQYIPRIVTIRGN